MKRLLKFRQDETRATTGQEAVVTRERGGWTVHVAKEGGPLIMLLRDDGTAASGGGSTPGGAAVPSSSALRRNDKAGRSPRSSRSSSRADPRRSLARGGDSGFVPSALDVLFSPPPTRPKLQVPSGLLSLYELLQATVAVAETILTEEIRRANSPSQPE